jgi:hypothetical protein
MRARFFLSPSDPADDSAGILLCEGESCMALPPGNQWLGTRTSSEKSDVFHPTEGSGKLQ